MNQLLEAFSMQPALRRRLSPPDPICIVLRDEVQMIMFELFYVSSQKSTFSRLNNKELDRIQLDFNIRFLYIGKHPSFCHSECLVGCLAHCNRKVHKIQLPSFQDFIFHSSDFQARIFDHYFFVLQFANCFEKNISKLIII